VEDYRTTLRRLALRDDRYIESLLADERESAALSRLDPGAHALARVGALIAMDAAPPSYMSAVEAAGEAGVTNEEIVGTLIAVLRVVGVARVVSAAPNLGLAIGYDVGDAFERLEPGRPRP
jgi:4-carboxymuconolactone decarboxylase